MPDINHLTWDEIGRISDGGDAPERLGLGATKTVSLKDGSVITLQIIDFNHDETAAGQLAPVTWETVHVLPKIRPINRNGGNYGGWEQGDVRRWLNRDFSQMLPDELRAIIKPVVKLTSAGNESSELIRTTDLLWLPSEVEVFGETSYSYPGEGFQYRFHHDEGQRHCKSWADATRASWWLRSPIRNGSGYFCGVYAGGSPSRDYASSSWGLAVALAT